MTRSRMFRVLAGVVACVTAGLLGVGAGPVAPRADAGSGLSTTTARLFAKVAGVDPGVFGTSLEGAAFDARGHFFFVDTTAPADRPKLMSLDLTTRAVTGLYEDGTSKLNCIGFGPDGTMYICDLNGRIVRFEAAGHRLVDVLTQVEDTAFVPNDLTIDHLGNMFIADYQGSPTAPAGRILLRGSDGSASALVTGLVHPNGIVLTPQQDGVWLSEDLAARLDHVGPQLSSPAATTPVITVHTASYLSLGASAYADSLTIDGAGNVYLAVYGAAEVLEFNPDGLETGRVTLPASAPKVTHVAIEPGTRHAFVTASGPRGGYIYTFQALAAAPAGMPNGG